MAGRLPGGAAEAVTRGTLASALQAELAKAGPDGAELAPVYAARNWRPLWLDRGVLRPEAQAALAVVRSAAADGLDPQAYDPQGLAQALREARPREAASLARAEAALSLAVSAYVHDLHAPPAAVGMIYTDAAVRPAGYSRAQVLEALSQGRTLADLTGMNPIYQGLRAALAEHQAVWAKLPAVTIPAGSSLGPGATGPRVKALRARLGLAPAPGYDAALQAAVARFQRAHGLGADGVADAATLAALNAPPERYASLLRVNLARARALPADLGRRFVLVNTAAATLWYYQDGQARDSMRVVVGKLNEPTPQVAGLIRYAVVRPYWNVPPDLVRASLAPKVLKGGLQAFTGQNMEALSDWSDAPQRLDPQRIDWAAVAAGRQELRVRQLPGPGNMMGRVKFMFPNELGVYLHDTPNKQAFEGETRNLSAGCVRLQDAARLARWLLAQGDAALADPSAPAETRVDLPRPVPVYLAYFTAAPDAAGGLALAPDVYRRDAPLSAALAPAGERPPLTFAER